MANENNKNNNEMMMVNGLIKFLSMRNNFIHKIHKKGIGFLIFKSIKLKNPNLYLLRTFTCAELAYGNREFQLKSEVNWIIEEINEMKKMNNEGGKGKGDRDKKREGRHPK